MFTGLVEELGRVRVCESTGDGLRLEIECAQVLDGLGVGDSVAVNGCCLTVVAVAADAWATHAQPETLARTGVGALRVGDAVNLERPLRIGDRLGGHLVQGHVDAVGSVTARQPSDDGSVRMEVEAPRELLRYVVEKGSVTVDGVSLTVTRVDDAGGGFEVALIPHTLAVTTLGACRPGDSVNLEVDVLAKYVERLVTHAREAGPELPGAELAGGASR